MTNYVGSGVGGGHFGEASTFHREGRRGLI